MGIVWDFLVELIGSIDLRKISSLCRFVPMFFLAVFRRSYLGTQTFFSVEFWREGRSSCPLHYGWSRLAFSVGTVEIWLFECLQPNFATFGYGGLGISSEIELLASGEHIFRLVVVGRLDKLNHYLTRWLSWVLVSGSKSGTRLTILSGDSIWVLGLVIGSSRSSLVVLWGTMVEMVELHVVRWSINYLHPHHRLLRRTKLSWITSFPYYCLVLRPHWFGIWTGVLGPWRAPNVT